MMIRVAENTYINANEVLTLKLSYNKVVQIVMKNGAEIQTQANTEEKTEILFHQLAKDIDTLQRQAIR